MVDPDDQDHRLILDDPVEDAALPPTRGMNAGQGSVLLAAALAVLAAMILPGGRQ